MQFRAARSLLMLLSGMVIATPLIAQNTLFLRNSPLAEMDETDREILRATIDSMLLAPDGTATNWSNPKTGSRGRIQVLDTHQDLGTTCRNIRMRNETRARTGGGNFRLCLAEDGIWKFAPNATE